MKKEYEVWHEIILSYQMGTVKAESLEEAREIAVKKFEKNPPKIEEYQENSEFIVFEE